jgi:acyl carrier protein
LSDAFQNKIREVIYRAVDQVNELQPDQVQIEKSGPTVLIGPDSTIDSMALVNLAVAVEDLIRSEFGVRLNVLECLIDESGNGDRIRTIENFEQQLAILLNRTN